MRCEPAQIRLCAFAQTQSRFDHDRHGRTPADAAGVTPGHEPLHPARARRTADPLPAFASPHTAAMGTLRHGMRRGHTLEVEKHSQCLPFPRQASGTRPGVVRPGRVVVAPGTETRLPPPPLPHCRVHCFPRTQPLERGVHAPPKATQACVETLCQSCGGADHLGSAALSSSYPRLTDSIAITDSHTSPGRKKLRKGNCGTVRVYLQGGHGRVCHAPQPLPLTMLEPRCLVHVVHQ